MFFPTRKKAYFEITNVCNLNCSFCPGTKRKKSFVDLDDFQRTAEKLKGKITYLYLHLMGEPTIHPELEEIIRAAGTLGFKVIITTNGTTLPKKGSLLLSSSAVYKISISLHSFEANGKEREEERLNYLKGCFDFARQAAALGKICVFRLWNLDGENTVGEKDDNPMILAQMRQYFGGEWADTRSGKRICDKIFLEYGEKFEWPDPENQEGLDENADCFCHGLRDQIGILCDGTVVPCCLDSEGSLPLGNLFDSDFDAIINSPAAKAIYDGFSRRRATAPLCRKCGYAKRFSAF
jgi:MoaA/NifB/PqqE/SkfB family radical SAM enzyme